MVQQGILFRTIDAAWSNLGDMMSLFVRRSIPEALIVRRDGPTEIKLEGVRLWSWQARQGRKTVYPLLHDQNSDLCRF
jgi:hypothetical protein